MKSRLIAAATLAAILLPTHTFAQNARSCGERAKIVERLEEGYGEERTGAGLSNANGMIEVFASTETGTWTIILTMPSGRACLLAAGEGWENGPGAVTKSGQKV